MEYFKNDVNLKLIGLLLFTCLALVSGTVYFQMQFAKINQTQGSDKSTVQKLSDELEYQKQLAATLEQELALKDAREITLSNKLVEERAKTQEPVQQTQFAQPKPVQKRTQVFAPSLIKQKYFGSRQWVPIV